MPNIHKEPDGTLIGFVHIETANWDDPSCQYRQDIAISSLALVDKAIREGKIPANSIIGDYWKYVGDVIKPNFDGLSNLGGAPLLEINGYFYQYFNELPLPQGSPRIPAVARARISDVVAAAKNGTVTTWMKYNNGKWDQPGLTGVGSNILPFPDRYDMHPMQFIAAALVNIFL